MEHDGQENEARDTGASGVPEGMAYTHPPLSDGLQALRVEPNPTADLSLDLLVQMDEPEQLLRALKDIASRRYGGPRGEIWAGLYQGAAMVTDSLELLNRPKSA